jgi:hypothetical protein
MTKQAFEKIASGLNQAIGYEQGQREAGQWRPIETAPKDGTEILLAHATWVDTGYWAVNINGDGCDGWTCEWVASWGYEEYALVSPSHWMPLPEPPAPVEQSGA